MTDMGSESSSQVLEQTQTNVGIKESPDKVTLDYRVYNAVEKDCSFTWVPSESGHVGLMIAKDYQRGLQYHHQFANPVPKEVFDQLGAVSKSKSRSDRLLFVTIKKKVPSVSLEPYVS